MNAGETTIDKLQQLNGDKTGVFKVWWACRECATEVGRFDAFCRGCGRRFTGNTRSSGA